MRDPHDVLGVRRGASHAEIRRAYRSLARKLHPDAGGSTGDAARLAEVTEAWRALTNPKPGGTREARRPASEPEQPAPPGPVVPARFPWRGMLWLAAVGIVVVVIASILSGPATEAPPDQLLGPGSCVTLDAVGTATEVSCTGPHDAVVTLLVASDGRCPEGTQAHRDRQGLGLACVVPPDPASGQ